MNLLIFEDQGVATLAPITTGRPAYAITCGSFRLIDRLPEHRWCRAVVRPHLREIQREDTPHLVAEAPPPAGPVLALNARLVPSWTTFQHLHAVAKQGEIGVVRHGNQVAAALLPATQAGITSVAEPGDVAARLFELAETLPVFPLELPLLEYPHDVVRHNMTVLGENLDQRLREGGYQEVRDGVFLAEGAQLAEFVVSDTRRGPILVDRDASIGPYCYLNGPAYIGPGARVIEHAAIKDAVSIGHTTKIGGEVEASVIEPFTNKQHHGFLGHSYLGSWINLGAGTCNSDLKNTYGEVKMEYGSRKVPTGMQFVGCMMGDYAKSAINTGIFTGKTIGACSMVYGFVTTNVPSFVNYARLFGQVTELPPEVMVATQQRMFVRRKVAQRPCDRQLILDMYELTRDERQLAGEPLSL